MEHRYRSQELQEFRSSGVAGVAGVAGVQEHRVRMALNFHTGKIADANKPKVRSFYSELLNC
jgi:hypothetical protein